MEFDTTNWKFTCVMDGPQQMNNYDCGVFACQYAEQVTRNIKKITFTQKDMEFFRRKMLLEIQQGHLLIRD